MFGNEYSEYDEEYYYPRHELTRENFQDEQDLPEPEYNPLAWWDPVIEFSLLGATTSLTILGSHAARLSTDWQVPFCIATATAIIVTAGMTALAKKHSYRMMGLRFLLAIVVGLVGGWIDALLLALAGSKGELIKIGLIGGVLLLVAAIWKFIEGRGDV